MYHYDAQTCPHVLVCEYGLRYVCSLAHARSLTLQISTYGRADTCVKFKGVHSFWNTTNVHPCQVS